MSGGTVFRRVLRALHALSIPTPAERDVLRALEAAYEPGLLQLFYEAAIEGGLEREDALLRASGCFVSFAAGNLADDVVDGDCDYLDDATRDGPTLQFLLQNLAWELWLNSGASRAALAGAARSLAAAAGPQQVEVRTRTWTAQLFADVAEGIAGRQWRAYLEVLWSGTALEPDAGRAGRAMGIAGHVAEDFRTADDRFFTMTPAEQHKTLALAHALTDELELIGSSTAILLAEVLRGRLQDSGVTP